MSSLNRKRKPTDSIHQLDVETSRLETLEKALKEMKEWNIRINETLASLKKDVTELRENHQSHNIIKNTKPEQQEEAISDDEKSVVDTSEQWESMFGQLREYRILNGHCNVPFKTPKLGYWVNNQRKQYKEFKTGKGRKMKQERVQRLESIGFSWGRNYPPVPSWEDMFQQLKTFKDQTGSCNVPFNANLPTPLAKWTAYQRKEYKRFQKGLGSILSLEQMGQLNEIGMNWNGPKL